MSRLTSGRLRIDRTTVEHADVLLGTDIAAPRLSWTLSADGRGARQTGYRILVASTPEKLEPGHADVWDSGRVDSARSVDVGYGGPPPRSRTRYHWRVQVWDQDGCASEWSRPTWWETALLGEQWAARWIGRATAGDDQPAPLLRREFALPRPVHRARLYITGLAYQEVHVNGQRVGTSVLDPGFTAYDRTVLYRTYDVTGLLSEGANAIAVELGNGFFNLRTSNTWDWHRPPWRAEPRLLAQLEVEHPDGSHTVVVSDESWRVTGGPTVSDSLYVGESYDARREQPGWRRPGFDDTTWLPADTLEAPAGRLVAQRHEAIEVAETVTPVRVSTVAPGTHVVDLGRTMAGWVQLRVDEPAGTKISMTYGEVLHADGTVTAANHLVAGDRYQRDEYIAAGRGRQTWEPRFSYKGFRYVQVEGLRAAPAPEDVLGKVVHSAVASAGTFRCSEPAYERFDAAMRRTVLNNLHGIPTDTPMYEKNGWTGDVQVALPSMVYSFDLARLFAKWAGDLADSQVGTGQLPVIVPSAGWGFEDLAPSPEWTTVYPYLVREMYRYYGDIRLAAEHWTGITGYLDWEIDRRQDGLAITDLGDWVAPGYQKTPPEDARLTATAYLYRALLAAAELGDLLGHTTAAGRYRGVAAECRDALNAAFLDRDAGHYRTAKDPDYRQTSNAVPLAFGMVPEEVVAPVVASLVDDIRKRGNHLNTGCLGTSELLPVLTAHGHADVAHAIATQTSYPSWGHWFEAGGADTMWEMWELDSRSRDHYFLGTVVRWLYENVAGLRVGDNGFASFAVRPDARHGVDWAEVTHHTVRGPIAVAWRRNGREFRLDVTVPVGAEAEVHVPAGVDATVESEPELPPTRDDTEYTTFMVHSGHWRFVAREGSGP